MCVRCLAAINRRLWVGLADGRIRVVALKPGPVAVEGEWLAHEAGVIALAPARSRVVSMAADGSIRAWSVAVGCPQEQLARQAFRPCPPQNSTQGTTTLPVALLVILRGSCNEGIAPCVLDVHLVVIATVQIAVSLTFCTACRRRPFSYQQLGWLLQAAICRGGD